MKTRTARRTTRRTARRFALALLLATLGACASYQDRTSPCVCDWRPIGNAGGAQGAPGGGGTDAGRLPA